MAPDDIFASSSSQNIPDSQSTVVSGVNLFLQCSVDVGKVMPGSEFQGSSMTDKPEIQRVSSQEMQAAQSPYLRVSDEAAFLDSHQEVSCRVHPRATSSRFRERVLTILRKT